MLICRQDTNREQEVTAALKLLSCDQHMMDTEWLDPGLYMFRQSLSSETVTFKGEAYWPEEKPAKDGKNRCWPTKTHKDLIVANDYYSCVRGEDFKAPSSRLALRGFEMQTTRKRSWPTK